MRVGLHLPQWGADADRSGVLSVAGAAEEGGLDSLWVADHLTYPLRSESKYPYGGSGDLPFAAEDGFLEAFITLATVAGATERIALGTSVFVLPMRHPLEVAKVIATLDVLSGGRLLVGIGAGWWAEEFHSLEQRFERRGDRLDEQLEIIRALWREGHLGHSGEFYEFEEVACEPRPLQPGGPPILIGGMGRRALRRAGTLGDGWHALGARPEVLAEGHAVARAAARAAGRDDSAVKLSTSIGLPGENDVAIERLCALVDLGVGNLVVNVHDQTASGLCAAIDRLASEILPEVRRHAGESQTTGKEPR